MQDYMVEKLARDFITIIEKITINIVNTPWLSWFNALRKKLSNLTYTDWTGQHNH